VEDVALVVAASTAIKVIVEVKAEVAAEVVGWYAVLVELGKLVKL
jgi:hypothetical protein